MIRLLKFLKYFVIVGVISIFLLVIYALILLDDNEFHTKEERYLESVGEKIGKYYLESTKLPNNLQSIHISQIYPYPSIKLFNVIDVKTASDYRLLYYPVDERNFSLVLTNKEKYVVYYYSDDWERFKKEYRFNPAFFVYNDIPYKSEQFLKGKEPPFNSFYAWPDI